MNRDRNSQFHTKAAKRSKNIWLQRTAGFLIAVLVVQLTHEFIAPNLVPGLVSVAEAATGTIDPNGDVGTNTGTRIGTCLTTTYADCLDDAVRNPTGPGTATDYVQMSQGQQTDSNMQTLTGVATVTSITVNVHHNETRNNMSLAVSLVNAAGTTIAGPTSLPYQATAAWSTATFGSLSLSQTTLDGLRVRVTCNQSGNPARQCNQYAMYADITYDPVINVTVSSLGNQKDLYYATTSAYVGGAFAIAGTNGTRNITSITIAEQGSVDAANHLKNIRLRYDVDNVAPFDCQSVSYSTGDTPYGSVDSDGFSATNGNSTFTGSVQVSPTETMCVYVEVDVLSAASQGQTIEIQITNPTTDVVGSGSPVIDPSTAVLLPNTTTLRQQVVTQANYHWRNDDGNETGATSATGGTENTSYDAFPKSQTKRVRFAVYNNGNATSTAIQYRLEHATKTELTCAAVASGWTDVGSTGGAFDMSNTANLTDGNNTTDISNGIGGVTNPDTDFETPNGGIRDTNSQTGNITLDQNDFVELEYAISANAFVSDGTTFCFRVTNAGTALDAYTNYAEATIAADALVDTIGTQTSQVTFPVSNQYSGGVFRITKSTAGTAPVTSITITASGTVDAQNDLSNVEIKYDVDTTNPYTCDDTAYAVGDTTFGTAATFNGSNQATFTGSVNVSPTATMCVYVEYDVDSDPSDGELLDIQIVDPSSEVVITGASVAPAAIVDVSGVTTFASSFLTQANYHWRNNDGNETGATSATGGTENTVLGNQSKNSTIRLRFAIGNGGLASSPSVQYRLEWKQKSGSCDDEVGTWTRIDTASDEFAMSPTGNLTDGANAANIPTGSGGVSNPQTSFLSSNGGIKDTTDTTTGVVLPSDNWLELEYSILATSNTVQGATYCFRVTDAGTPLDAYTNYPELTIKLDNDFRIQRGVTTISTSTATIFAGSQYEAPSSTARAFIRITNTQLTGAGPSTGNSNSNANDVTVFIQNPSNLLNAITFERAGSAGDTRVSWEIVEYTGVDGGENEIIVRREEAVTYGGGNATVSGATTGTIVDDNDVVVFITGQNNDNAGRNNFMDGLSTAAWNGTSNQADFTRGGSTADSNVSYALVEFTGANWNVQRVEHTYSAASSTETVGITAINSPSRAFLHVQKRTSENDHADFGHEVWISGLAQVSFMIDGQAANPGNHTSVAWVIENTQTVGEVMVVSRSSAGFTSGGTGPSTTNIPIGKTLDDLTIASLFVNNRSNEVQRSWPEPIFGARLISTSQYELWRSDTTADTVFRTEVVEWPTAARKLTQDDFQIYVDNNAQTPSVPWSGLGENAPMTVDDNPMPLGSTTRIRINLAVSAAALPAGLDTFNLQYGEFEDSCSAITEWHDLGEIGSTTALWRGVNNTPSDGTALSTDPPTGGDLLLTFSTVAGTYEEENPTALNPYTAFPGDEIEYDWVVQHNGAADKTSYCFRMVEADGSELEGYNTYPILRTVGYEPLISNWRWYGDETTNPTPLSPLAAENVTPNDIVNQDAIKLRLVLREGSGAAGNNVKFALEYSEYADFSQNVATVTSITNCAADSLWCYYDGFGADNGVIQSTVISNADTCLVGIGDGCGTFNESTSTVGTTQDQNAFTDTEFEFTIQQNGARARAVYYFRLYNVVDDEYVPLDSGASYPSVMIEGAQLVFSVGGVTSGTNIADITTDVTTSPTAISFGSLPIGSSIEAAQRITVDTNATEGYQILQFADQQLTNVYGDEIDPISSTNAFPDAWTDACSATSTGCFGYHTTDATLFGESGRFSPLDSYAALDTDTQEIMYSSIPATDVHDIVYRAQVSQLQPAGEYQASIVYIAVPVF